MNALARCESCGHEFEVARSLVGGFANCPSCGKATPVEGLRDPLWRGLQLVGWIALAALVMLVLHLGGPFWALLAGLGGAGLLWLVSRGF